MVRARKSQARVTLAEGQCCATPGFDSALEVPFVLYLKFFSEAQWTLCLGETPRSSHVWEIQAVPGRVHTSSTTFQTGHFHTHMMQEKAGGR